MKILIENAGAQKGLPVKHPIQAKFP